MDHPLHHSRLLPTFLDTLLFGLFALAGSITAALHCRTAPTFDLHERITAALALALLVLSSSGILLLLIAGDPLTALLTNDAAENAPSPPLLWMVPLFGLTGFCLLAISLPTTSSSLRCCRCHQYPHRHPLGHPRLLSHPQPPHPHIHRPLYLAARYSIAPSAGTHRHAQRIPPQPTDHLRLHRHSIIRAAFEPQPSAPRNRLVHVGSTHECTTNGTNRMLTICAAPPSARYSSTTYSFSPPLPSPLSTSRSLTTSPRPFRRFQPLYT